MEFRTTFDIAPSDLKITYNDPVMFIGSCFAASMGKELETGRMPVMINPSGTVYNPVSVCNTLDTITSLRKYEVSDLHNHNGTWLSFNHYTDFSSDNPESALENINKKIDEAGNFIQERNSCLSLSELHGFTGGNNRERLYPIATRFRHRTLQKSCLL